MVKESNGSALRKVLLITTAMGICATVNLTPTPVAAEGDDAASAAGTAGAVAAIDAAALWAKNCKSCHGDDGKGQTKAGKMKQVKDLTDAEVRSGFDRDRMIRSVGEGLKDDAGKVLMKPYNEKMSAEEIAAVVDYVFALPH